MKKKLLSALAVGFLLTSFAQAQITKTLIGSSYNMYTVLEPETNAVHSSDELGTVSFTHRQNADLPGGSGIIQTSYSTDGGATWNYVLTHDTLSQVNRYPSGVLVDPSGAGKLADAQAVVVGPTLVGGGWGGIFTNNIALDGSEAKENLIIDSESTYPSFTMSSMMLDDNGVVRVCGYNNNVIDLVVTTGTYDADGQSTFTDQYATYKQAFASGGFGVGSALAANDTVYYMTSANPDMYYSGEIDSAWTNEIRLVNYAMVNGVHTAIDTVDLGWKNIAYHEDDAGGWNAVESTPDTFYVQGTGIINTLEIAGDAGYYWTQQGFVSEGLVELYDYSMAFSKDGNTGYLVAQGTDTSGQIVPFVHHTTDAGATWMQMSHDFSAIEGYVAPGYNGGIDCAVDANGTLHMISSILEQAESAEETNHKLYDITVNTSSWSANYIANINTEKVADDHAAAIHGIGYNHRIQAARSNDGSKVFAVWTDVNLDEFDVESLEYPDIYAYGIDINTGLSTGIKNFTEATSYEGDNFWMFTSPVAATTDDGYALPTTTSVADAESDVAAMEHYYVSGIEFNEDDFIVGLEDFNANISVNSFPNPATTFANIEISLENSADVAVSLTNTLGQEVYSSVNNFRTGLNTISIDVKEFETGTYIYMVSTENFSTTGRLIIK